MNSFSQYFEDSKRYLEVEPAHITVSLEWKVYTLSHFHGHLASLADLPMQALVEGRNSQKRVFGLVQCLRPVLLAQKLGLYMSAGYAYTHDPIVETSSKCLPLAFPEQMPTSGFATDGSTSAHK